MKSENIIVEYNGKILGSYLPNIKSLFLNHSVYDLESDETEKQNARVTFHERFHNWQSIFTPFGQLRWYVGQKCTDDVVGLWEKFAVKDERFRKIPIGNIISEDKETLAFAVMVNFIAANEEIIRIMQYGVESDTYALFDAGIPDYISPEIIYNGKTYQLNGIDIIESYDKYQEALYGELVNGEKFEEILNIEKLNKEYYLPYLYYLSEIGDSMLFPIACEIALMSYEIPDIRDMEQWKQCSIAWRFISVVQLIKSNSSVPSIKFEKIHESYIKVVEFLLKELKYKGYRETYEKMYTEQNSLWSDPLIDEMNIAIEYKNKYPAVLSYPFLIDAECVDLLYKFEPHFWRYVDDSSMLKKRDLELYGKVSGNEGKWQSRLLVQLHRKALAFQIRGIASERRIYDDMLQCGCGFFDVKACPFYPQICNGYLELNNELEYVDPCLEKTRLEVKKVMEMRRDDNIEEYENKRAEKIKSPIESCPLDAAFQVQYKFGIQDIKVDMKKKMDINEIKDKLKDV